MSGIRTGGNERNETRLMVGGFNINMERAWIIAQFVPGLQGIVRSGGRAVHGNSVGQRSEDRKTCQKTGPDSRIRLLIPPNLGDFIVRMTLNQQRE
jgi:hypothetical protein